MATMVTGCGADATTNGLDGTYPLVMVVFFVACFMMLKATAVLVQTMQLLWTAITELVAAMAECATMVVLAAGVALLAAWMILT